MLSIELLERVVAVCKFFVLEKINHLECNTISFQGLNYHDKEKTEWEPGTACDELALVGVVLECEDEEHEQSTADELIKELAGLGQVRSWVGGENTGSARWVGS